MSSLFQLFDLLRQKAPNFLDKVGLLNGDCQSPGLGLGEEDKELIKKNVNFIFHSAATVRFDQHIETAFRINVLATKDLLEISREAQNLKVSF